MILGWRIWHLDKLQTAFLFIHIFILMTGLPTRLYSFLSIFIKCVKYIELHLQKPTLLARRCFAIALIVRFGESKLYSLESFVFLFRSRCSRDARWLVFITLILNRPPVSGCLGPAPGTHRPTVPPDWPLYCLLSFYPRFTYKFLNELLLSLGVH